MFIYSFKRNTGRERFTYHKVKLFYARLLAEDSVEYLSTNYEAFSLKLKCTIS